MAATDRITFSGGHYEDVFVHCEDCGDIIGVDPETLKEVLSWVEGHKCGGRT